MLRNAKRGLSLVMAWIMVLSMLPVQAFAAETEEHGNNPETEPQIVLETMAVEPETVETTIAAETVAIVETEPEKETEAVYTEETTIEPVPSSETTAENPVIAQYQAEIDSILNAYLGTTAMSQEELQSAVDAMDWETYQTARWEISILTESAYNSIATGQVSEDELRSAVENYPLFIDFCRILEDRAAADSYLSTFAAAATERATLSCGISISDEKDRITKSSETEVIAKATVGWSFGGGSEENNVILTNNSGSKAIISFEYTASDSGTDNGYSITSSPAGENTGGKYTVTLENGGTINIKLKAKAGGFSSKTVTFTMTNISLAPVADSAKVTFAYDDSLGTVTGIANGDVVEATSDGISLTATPASGAVFLGWLNAADNKIISQQSSYTLVASGDMTVKAAFAKSTPWFYIDNKNYLAEGLNAAISSVASATSKIIILANNATLEAGDYTIPSGVTLLIPFDTAGTCYTTEPVAENATPKDPIPFRTLTMTDGAKITVNGIMSVSSKVYAGGSGQTAGMPKGEFGHIAMNEGSSIVVNSGATLSVFGYITGAGSVTANSGATVYEVFQIMDFRGGQATFNMNGITSSGNDGDVFPFSQYYAQNIEVPLTIHAGATEKAYTALYMSRAVVDTTVAYIGSGDSGAMFNLTSGYMIKRYDKATDRLVADIYGDLTIANVSIDIKLGITYTVNSKVYVLPINSNMTVNVNSGTVSAAQDLAMLPGSQVNISSDAKFILGSSVRLYAYDGDQWGNYVYNNAKLKPVAYVYNRAYTRTAADLIDACITVAGTLDASAGALYTTSSGAAIKGVEGGKVIAPIGSEKVTYQASQSGTDVSYPEIPITPAQLLNADKSYTKTADATANSSNTYTYTNGVWRCATHTEVTDAAVSATCSGTGLTEGKHCSACGTVTAAQEEIAALGHTEEAIPGKAATCTEAGLTDGKKCTTCGEITVAQEEIAALGHTEEVIPGKAATCTEAGLTDGKKCATCGEITVAQEEIAALGHTEVIDAAKAPTCTATGLTEGKHCSVCNTVLVAQTEVAATGHSYETKVTAPTCTEDGYTTYTCSACGDSYVDNKVAQLGHSYDEGVVTTAPGCEATGVKTFTCGTCGDTYTEVVAATGHSYSAVVTAPTCTAKGYTTYTCACGHSYTADEVAATGHKYTDVTYSWEEDGSACTATRGCSKCDLSESAVAEISSEATKAATCIAKGETTYTATFTDTWAEKQTTVLKDVPVNASNHEKTEVTYEVTAETHTVVHSCCGGKEEAVAHTYNNYVCVCEAHQTFTVIWQAEGSDDVTVTVNGGETITLPENTPTKEGYTFIGWFDGETKATAETVCTGNVTYTAKFEINQYTITFDTAGGNTIAAIKQDYGTTVTAPADPTKTGYTFAGWDKKVPATMPAENLTITAQWTVNEYTITFNTDGGSAIAAIKQDYGTTVTAPAAPTKTGYTFAGWDVAVPATMPAENVTITAQWDINTYTVTFTVNGEAFDEVDYEYGAAVTAPAYEIPEGHTFSGWDVPATMPAEDITLDAALTANTYTVTWVNEGTTFDTTTVAYGEAIAAPKNTPVKPKSGCTVYTFANWEGLTEGMTMPAKNLTFTAVYTEKIEHTSENVNYKNVTETTHDEYYACCNALKAEKVAHTWDDGKVTSNPTCEAEGVKTFICEFCEGTKTEAIEKLGHDYDAVVTAPTCEAKGYTTYTCKHDATHTYVGNEVAALGHDYAEEVTTEPGCETVGVKTFTCGTCGDTYTEEIAATGHTEVIDAAVAATCTETGLTEGKHCTVCGKVTAAQEEVAALGHTDGAVVVENNVAPDCVNEGSYDNVTYCTVCGVETSRATVTVDALGHEYDAVVTDPTCTEAGYTTYTCSACGDSYVADEVAALGHTDGEIVVENEKAATCTAAGSYDNVTRCTVCGVETSRETITVEALGHNEISHEAQAPTCTEIGWDAYVTCSRCDYTTYVEKEALGHTDLTYTDLKDGNHKVTCGCGEVVTASEAHTYDAETHMCVCKAVELFNVTFTVNGEAYGEPISVAYGAEITAPAYEIPEGHTFSGWDVPATMPAEDITLDATLTVNKYTIRFINEDGTELQSSKVTHGEMPEYTGETPTKAADAENTYTFAGWDPEIVAATADADYTATFTAEPIKVYVAQVGETQYETLAAAIEAAGENGAVTLLANITEAVTVNKAVTITKNGFTVTVVAGEGFEVAEDTADSVVIQITEVDVKVLTLAGNSLLFKDIIHIKYYYEYNGASYDKEYIQNNGGILVWETKQDSYTPGTESYKVAGLTASGSYYFATGEGIPAKEMGDMLYACAYLKNEDGTYSYSDVTGYSPQKYAENMLPRDSTSSELKTLIIAMMNYGTAAQHYFTYKTDTPMNSILTDDQKNWTWDASMIKTKIEPDYSKLGFEMDETITIAGFSLLYTGAIGIKVYNSVPATLVTGAQEMGLLYWSEDDYLNNETLTEANASGRLKGLTKSGSYYYATIQGTPAKNLGDTYFICAYVIDSNGNIHYGKMLSYSAHYYASRQINGADKTTEMKNICKTMVIYGTAATTYFG